MNPERAEIRPHRNPGIILPRELRLPIAASRMFLSTLSGFGGVIALDTLINPSLVEAAGCKGAIKTTVRNYKDVGGVKNQYDQIIDVAKDHIPGAKINYSVEGRSIGQATADDRGQTETRINTPCTTSDGKKIEVQVEVSTPDGRRGKETWYIQDNKIEEFKLWVVEKGPISEQKAEIKQDQRGKGEEKEGFKLPVEIPDMGGLGGNLAWLPALLAGLALLTNRPHTRLQNIRLNRPRTRLGNTLAWPVRELRYRFGPLRVHNQELANGTIPAGTPPPARGYPGPWSV